MSSINPDVRPKYYLCQFDFDRPPIEAIDFLLKIGGGFCLQNCIKYMFRVGLKEGQAASDLQKIITYINLGIDKEPQDFKRGVVNLKCYLGEVALLAGTSSDRSDLSKALWKSVFNSLTLYEQADEGADSWRMSESLIAACKNELKKL